VKTKPKKFDDYVPKWDRDSYIAIHITV
jgi:hypothetical protein